MIGYIHFDDSEQPSSGWGCCMGYRNSQAFRIRGPGELPSDCLWVSNINYKNHIQHLSAFPQIKRDNYFRSNTKLIAGEIGSAQPHLPIHEMIVHLAEVFERIYQQAKKQWDLNLLTNNQDTFAEAIKHVLLPPEHLSSLEINTALEQAYQGDSKCSGSIPALSKHTTFLRARIRHTIDILSTPIPDDCWTLVPSQKLPPQERCFDWIQELKQPVLAQVSLTTEPKVAPLIAFGSSNIGFLKNRIRQWASNVELAMLAPYTQIKFRNLFLAQGISPLQNLRNTLPSIGVSSWLSVCDGLLWENIWTALATPRRGTNKLSGLITTPRSVWLRAADRAHSFLAALPFYQLGFHVGHYGHGTVSTFLRSGENEAAIECANRELLLAPLTNVIEKEQLEVLS